MNQGNYQAGASPLTETPVSIGVIVLCAAAYLGGFQPLGFMLWPLDSGVFTPFQLITYGFLHGNFNHLFFNMFAVWMFGLPVERMWGSKRFTLYYFTCVLGAAAIQLLVQYLSGDIYPTIGASGAIYGLFNRWSLLAVEYDPSLCRDCGSCVEGCEVELDPRRGSRSRVCLRCLGCATHRCPTGALSVRIGSVRIAGAPCDPRSTPAS